MPTYEYVCKECGHHWEAFQSMKDDALTDCPACSRASAQRQVSVGAGFILKGGGWYSDLYASAKPGGAKPGGGESAGGSSGAEKGAGKSDAAKDGAGAATSSESKTSTKTASPGESTAPAKSD